MSKFKISVEHGKYVIKKNENPMWRLLIAEGFGEDSGEFLSLHPVEATYLIMKRRATLDELDAEESLRKIIADASMGDDLFLTKLIAYLDLRERQYPVRVIRGKPTCFEVYERGSNVLIDKPSRLIMVVPAEKSVSIEALDGGLNTAKSMGIPLVLAIVDQDGDVVYYRVDSTLRFKVSLKLKRGL